MKRAVIALVVVTAMLAACGGAAAFPQIPVAHRSDAREVARGSYDRAPTGDPWIAHFVVYRSGLDLQTLLRDTRSLLAADGWHATLEPDRPGESPSLIAWRGGTCLYYHDLHSLDPLTLRKVSGHYLITDLADDLSQSAVFATSADCP